MYTKPILTVLGNAASVVLGGDKDDVNADTVNPSHTATIAAYEADE